MAFTKTRIWRGGIAGVTPDAAPPPEDEAPEPLPFSDTLHGNFSSAEQEHLERAAERVSSSVLPGFQVVQPTPSSTTRFLPIEQLFPEQHEQARRTHALTPAPQPAWGARVRGLFSRRTTTRREQPVQQPERRRLLLGVCALLVLALAAGLLAPVLRAPEPAPEASALEPESGALAADVAPESPAPADDPAQPAAQQQASLRAAKPVGLERSAVDALISGDLARATDLYQRLSQSAPDERVYREALRILRDRGATR